HRDRVVRLSSSLPEAGNLPELSPHFFDHHIRAFPHSAYRCSREDEGKHRPDQCAYHDSRLVQSEFCAQGGKPAREVGGLACCYRCKVEDLGLVSCHLQQEGLKEE